MAAALALLASRHSLRVLLCEVEGKKGLSTLFDSMALNDTPLKLAEGLDGMNISADEALKEYFSVQLHMKRIAKPLLDSNLVYYVTHAAPGLRDILMLGKVWYEANRRKRYDLIVLDTPAAGHAVSMLRSPEGFLQAVPMGPVAKHARQVAEWLKDPDQVAVHLVSMAEEMPANETIETVSMLEDRLGIDVSGIFVNMLYPPLEANGKALPGELGAEELLSRSESAGCSLSQNDSETLAAAAEFSRSRYELQQENRGTMDEALADTATIFELPFLFTDRFGLREVDELASRIEEQAAG